MKIGIIGAGNMGGAIVRGLIQGTKISAKEITVADPSVDKRLELKRLDSQINTVEVNQDAINGADIILIAVKPWLVKEVVTSLQPDLKKQIVVSIAAGIPLEEYTQWLGGSAVLYRLVPNTAISILQSMTLVASLNATKEQDELILDIFSEMGLAMLIPEKLIPATTALTSCGIAFVMKYIQAGMQAGVELGVYPNDAMRMVAQSVKGAAELILNNDTHPSLEIDKVTTPGGLTIKGINELEHAGFASAIIRAIKVICNE